MGAYIGSLIGKLGNSYLDERQNQDALRRQQALDAQNASDRQAAIQDRRTTLQRLQEQMDFQQSEASRKTQLAEQEREALRRALLSKGLPPDQVEGMLGDAATARSFLAQPKPVKNRVKATFTVDGKTPMMGSFDQEEGAYYDAKGNRVDSAQEWQKPEQMSEFQRKSLALQERRLAQGNGQRPIPSPIAQKLADFNSGLELINGALDAVTKEPEAFGAKNYLPDIALERINRPGYAGGYGARAVVEGVVGELRKGRFGGALTPLEAEKAARIFSEPQRKAETILQQLQALRNLVATRRKALSAQFGGAGGGTAPMTIEDLWENP